MGVEMIGEQVGYSQRDVLTSYQKALLLEAALAFHRAHPGFPEVPYNWEPDSKIPIPKRDSDLQSLLLRANRWLLPSDSDEETFEEFVEYFARLLWEYCSSPGELFSEKWRERARSILREISNRTK